MCVCATRQPVSTLTNRRLRAEPTQLLQGIVGSRVMTETSTVHRCLDLKTQRGVTRHFRSRLENKVTKKLAKKREYRCLTEREEEMAKTKEVFY